MKLSRCEALIFFFIVLFARNQEVNPIYKYIFAYKNDVFHEYIIKKKLFEFSGGFWDSYALIYWKGFLTEIMTAIQILIDEN